MNSLRVIAPYRHLGMWVFDDPTVGLVQEPFVAGADTLIDLAVAHIGDVDKGFKLIFSAGPFPGYSLKLDWVRAEMGGNTYHSSEFNVEGWLCPALFLYFKEAPSELYAKVESIE